MRSFASPTCRRAGATFAFLADLWEDNAAERAQLEQDMVREAEAMLRGMGE